MKQLMWVSEWRIEPATKEEKEYHWNYRVSNGGVYTPADTLEQASKILYSNIREEMNRYRLYNLTCPSCSKPFSEHQGSVSYERCLISLAVHESLGVRF